MLSIVHSMPGARCGHRPQ